MSTDNAVRGGDSIPGLTGVLEYFSFGAWKVRPVSGEDYTVTRWTSRRRRLSRSAAR